MIALQSGCLLFQLASGESVPCSVEMISVELTGNAGDSLDPEDVYKRQAPLPSADGRG